MFYQEGLPDIRFCHFYALHFTASFRSARINFKVLLHRFKALHGLFPQYLQKGFKAFQKGFQRVSEVFPKGFKSVCKGFQTLRNWVSKGFQSDLKPLKNAFVDKTCFRMEGHILGKRHPDQGYRRYHVHSASRSLGLQGADSSVV